MKNIFLLLLLLLLVHCESPKTPTSTPKTKSEKSPSSTQQDTLTYTEKLEQIAGKTVAEKQSYFYTYISQDIPLYWNGTPWDFNGTTRTPKSGSIACGYFITNTLADYGFSIQRVYLAQQPSSVLIQKVCTAESIKRFANFDDLKNYIEQRKEHEIYIVGLDFHTGYMFKEDTDLYFLHANYIQAQGVVKEKAQSSKALQSSESFMIGCVDNKKYSIN